MFHRNSYFPTRYAYSPSEREPRLLQKGYVTLSSAALCCGLVSLEWVLGALAKAGCDRQLVQKGWFGQGGRLEEKPKELIFDCSVTKAILSAKWVYGALGHTHRLVQTVPWKYSIMVGCSVRKLVREGATRGLVIKSELAMKCLSARSTSTSAQAIPSAKREVGFKTVLHNVIGDLSQNMKYVIWLSELLW